MMWQPLLYILYLITYATTTVAAATIDDLPSIDDLPLNCHWSSQEEHLVICNGVPSKPIYSQLVL